MKTVYLPYADAVQLEAMQNYDHHQRVSGDEDDEMPDFAWYVEEAEIILTQNGEGLIPEFDDHYHVFVKGVY